MQIEGNNYRLFSLNGGNLTLAQSPLTDRIIQEAAALDKQSGLSTTEEDMVVTLVNLHGTAETDAILRRMLHIQKSPAEFFVARPIQSYSPYKWALPASAASDTPPDIFLKILRDLNAYFAEDTTMDLVPNEFTMSSYCSIAEFIKSFNSSVYGVLHNYKIESIVPAPAGYQFIFFYKNNKYLKIIKATEIANLHLGEKFLPVTKVYPGENLEEPRYYYAMYWCQYLNTLLLPDKPITRVNIRQEFGLRNSYNNQEHLVTLTTGSLYFHFRPTITHEFAHGYFNVKLADPKDLTGRDTKNKTWEMIFAYALGERSYEIVDDSNYEKLPDSVGHPSENPTELFASSVSAYIHHPEVLAANINSAPEHQKKTGILIWCFLRERVFQNKVFGADDPFKNYTLAKLTITQAELLEALESALSDSPELSDRLTSPDEISLAAKAAEKLLVKYRE